jgi:hypothetical protein
MNKLRTRITISGFIILLLLQIPYSHCQSNTITLSLHSSDTLYCDHSSPAVLEFDFADATSLNTSQIYISVLKNTSDNQFVEYTDSFGDNLYHTTYSTNNSHIIARTSIGSGNQPKGNYSLKVIITLINSSQIQLISNNSRIFITRNEAGNIQAESIMDLEINDSSGGERRKTYTYDDLKTMTTGQLITFFIMVLVNNYAWLIVFFIAIWLFGRYRGYRKLVF